MSDIKNIDSKILVGYINKLEIDTMTGTNNAKFDVRATIQTESIWTDCVICEKYVHTNQRLLDEGICHECKEAMVDRIRAVLQFQ